MTLVSLRAGQAPDDEGERARDVACADRSGPSGVGRAHAEVTDGDGPPGESRVRLAKAPRGVLGVRHEHVRAPERPPLQRAERLPRFDAVQEHGEPSPRAGHEPGDGAQAQVQADNVGRTRPGESPAQREGDEPKLPAGGARQRDPPERTGHGRGSWRIAQREHFHRRRGPRARRLERTHDEPRDERDAVGSGHARGDDQVARSSHRVALPRVT